ncbi:unnamed protein product [Chondrus crispus]|uniref:Probable ATP-dependent transporter ycf16 n=1 Tax=Chondrus crispus TaxID=2769 RepID=R7QQ95_CHOCR|nr:unnamed protein product [Chondrus crispus]CDF40294.1 unnamed protein product [Chondrus crispus]|eukprot:XP_005710588.1 unnamed protein product [Chondrus crispus]
MYAVVLSAIQKFFWNVLSSKDAASFGRLVAMYGAAVLVGPVVLALFQWAKERLALMWRRALTEHLLAAYFEDRRYYALSVNANEIDNPDQRIAEDVRNFTSRAVRFFTIAGVAFFDVIVFAVILYRVYAPLLYILLAYSAAGTVMIAFAGARLLPLNREQAVREANFRFGLVRVREATESVAFYAGEDAERSELQRRFASAFRNNLRLLALQRNVGFLSASFRYWAQLVPTVVVAPQYFAGSLRLGSISQVYFSFNHVLNSLGLFVAEFSALAEFGAGVRRLKGLADSLADRGDPGRRKILTELDKSDEAQSLRLTHLTVETPSAPPRVLVDNLSLHVPAGGRLVVVGRSGIGKSSLMRAVCGLWDSGSGAIERPSASNTLFLPQRPFLMLGSLRENVIYPSTRGDVTDADVEDALRRVNLGYLIHRDAGLDAPGETLTRRLSLGEQQRLAFARIVISRPKLVVLDESSSALDLDNEADMYRLIDEMGATCISVGNRPTLLEFHDQVLRIQGNGEWEVETPEKTRERLNKSLHS